MKTSLAPERPCEPWNLSPAPDGHARFAWDGGEFETASRRHTSEVEGSIRSSKNLIMVTLNGGARRHEFSTEDGFRFSGRDRMGSASFLPAGCERRLSLSDVSWEWATISLPDDGSLGLPKHAFAGEADMFLAGMLGQFRQILQVDGALDPIYCDSMKLALVQYLRRRDRKASEAVHSTGGLTPRQLRSVSEYVDANLTSAIRIAELAQLTDLSDGYFHRAFRRSTGQTPLAFVTARRIDRAIELLARPDLSIAHIALDVGFQGQSHFARTFRAAKGVSPQVWRSS